MKNNPNEISSINKDVLRDIIEGRKPEEAVALVARVERLVPGHENFGLPAAVISFEFRDKNGRTLVRINEHQISVHSELKLLDLQTALNLTVS